MYLIEKGAERNRKDERRKIEIKRADKARVISNFITKVLQH
jgi:hypothetical protein